MGKTSGSMRTGARVFALCLMLVAAAAFDMPGMKKKKYKPFKSAIPHIRCGVCKELAHALHSQVEALPPADKPAGKISSRGKAPKKGERGGRRGGDHACV